MDIQIKEPSPDFTATQTRLNTPPYLISVVRIPGTLVPRRYWFWVCCVEHCSRSKLLLLTKQ